MGIACSTCEIADQTSLDFSKKRFVGNAKYTKGELGADGAIVTMSSEQRMIDVWRSGTMMRYVFVGIVGQPPVPPERIVVNHGIVVNERQVLFRNKDSSTEVWYMRADGSIRSIYSTSVASWDTVFTPLPTM